MLVINCSRGLIIIWSEEFKTNEQKFRSRDCIATTFPELNIVYINAYLHPNNYLQLRHSNSSLSKIKAGQLIVLTGDFNYLNYDMI